MSKIKNNNFINKLKKDFPKINFILSEDFLYSPEKKEIQYNTEINKWELLLLHEIGHFLSNHKQYNFDRELLKIEVEAWEIAKEKLAQKYNIEIDYELIENTLSSYKEWLYKRSKCPKCNSIGLQKKIDQYFCLSCNTNWKVNQAKFTQLKRIEIKK